MKKTHHDICGACEKISTEWTPKDFPLPGDIAEKILRASPSFSLTHHLISAAIAERDKMWVKKQELSEIENT